MNNQLVVTMKLKDCLIFALFYTKSHSAFFQGQACRLNYSLQVAKFVFGRDEEAVHTRFSRFQKRWEEEFRRYALCFTTKRKKIKIDKQ